MRQPTGKYHQGVCVADDDDEDDDDPNKYALLIFLSTHNPAERNPISYRSGYHTRLSAECYLLRSSLFPCRPSIPLISNGP